MRSLIPLFLASLVACDVAAEPEPVAGPFEHDLAAAAPVDDRSAQGLRWLQGEADLSEGAVVVVFWEAWCPHCKTGMPEVEHLAQSTPDVRFVGVTRLTRNTPEAKARQFLADRAITFPNAIDDGQLAAEFGVRGVPSAVVLEDGEQVWSGHPSQIDDEVLALVR